MRILKRSIQETLLFSVKINKAEKAWPPFYDQEPGFSGLVLTSGKNRVDRY